MTTELASDLEYIAQVIGRKFEVSLPSLSLQMILQNLLRPPSSPRLAYPHPTP